MTIQLLCDTSCIVLRDKSKTSQLEIEIRTTTDAAYIAINDNRIGIPEDILPKVFNMFNQGNGESQGEGLGLIITKQSVTTLKRNIEIISTSGKGTCGQSFNYSPAL